MSWESIKQPTKDDILYKEHAMSIITFSSFSSVEFLYDIVDKCSYLEIANVIHEAYKICF